MKRFEKWANDLGVEGEEQGHILGRIVAEAYMKGFEEALVMSDAEVADMTEAQFIGGQMGKLMEWYLEESSEAIE